MVHNMRCQAECQMGQKRRLARTGVTKEHETLVPDDGFQCTEWGAVFLSRKPCGARLALAMLARVRVSARQSSRSSQSNIDLCEVDTLLVRRGVADVDIHTSER
jgi:hypothetical protein